MDSPTLTPLCDCVSVRLHLIRTGGENVPKKTMPDFEAALAELEKLVDKMESGEQRLEDALKSFQRGVELTRTCQQALKQAEQRVEKLVQKDGRLITENLEIKE